MRDVIIIGGGHNALVAGGVLAEAGLKPLVLERGERVGGCASTSELAPGIRCPTLAHMAAIDPAIVRALALERHGLQIIRPPAAGGPPPPGGGGRVGGWFEGEPLRAPVAAGGVLGSFVGPRSAGSAALLLWLGAVEGHPIAAGWLARGGTGAVADALASAAREAG